MNSHKKTSTKKKFFVVIFSLLLLVLAFFYYNHSLHNGEEELPFETTLIQQGDLSTTVSSTGSLAAKGTVEIGTRVSGTLDTISVDYNDHVKKGQILATLDQSLFRVEMSAARATVTSATAKLEQAQSEYDRNILLNQKGFLSDEEFLVFKTNLTTSKASVKLAKASLSRAQIDLNFTVIRAPIDGTVIERSIEEGQTVAASLSTPTLFIIAEDLSQMQIEADVDESDIGQIKVGQTAEFEVAAYPERRFTGKVNQIRLSPETISNVVTYTVVIEAKNDEGILFPGMTATVDFIINSQKNVLLVPDTALLVSLEEGEGTQKKSATNQDSIYLLKNGQPPQEIVVKKLLSDGSKTAIVGENIRKGMRIITAIKSGVTTKRRGIFSKLMPGPPGQNKNGGKK